MSIFDAQIGARPNNPPIQAPDPQIGISATTESASIALAHIEQVGTRPIPSCDPRVIWPEASITMELDKLMAELPPIHPALPGIPAEDALAAIDTALRRNNARVAVNGLFDFSEASHDHDWNDR